MIVRIESFRDSREAPFDSGLMTAKFHPTIPAN
jgi:hypothetical protein